MIVDATHNRGQFRVAFNKISKIMKRHENELIPVTGIYEYAIKKENREHIHTTDFRMLYYCNKTKKHCAFTQTHCIHIKSYLFYTKKTIVERYKQRNRGNNTQSNICRYRQSKHENNTMKKQGIKKTWWNKRTTHRRYGANTVKQNIADLPILGILCGFIVHSGEFAT